MSNTPDEKALKQRAEKEGIFRDALTVAQTHGTHDYSATDAHKVSITSVFNDAANSLTVQNIYTQWEDKYPDGRPRVNSKDSIVVTVKGQEVFRADGPRADDIKTYVPGHIKSAQGIWDLDLFYMRQDAWLFFEARARFSDAFAAARKKHDAEKLKKPTAEKPKNPKFGGPR